MTSETFRDLLGEPGCVVIPAVYDALSARIAERVGFRAVGLAASWSRRAAWAGRTWGSSP